jgi:hypothetical protein
MTRYSSYLIRFTGEDLSRRILCGLYAVGTSHQHRVVSCVNSQISALSYDSLLLTGDHIVWSDTLYEDPHCERSDLKM